MFINHIHRIKQVLPLNTKTYFTTLNSNTASCNTTPSTFIPNRNTPQKDQRNILITAALPYVNNTPHLGNIIGAILSADTYARYCRMRGYNTLFICGTDQYGTTTQVKALKQHTTPQQICNKYHVLHTQIYNWFNIQFDHFGRTSKPIHTEITVQIFKQIYKNGGFQLKTMNQYHCESCRISLADRYVGGICGTCGGKARGDQCDGCGKVFGDPTVELKEPKCQICAKTPVVKQSKHLYLKLNQCSQKLKKWLLQQNGMKLWTNNAKGVTKAWLNQGLQNRCITRNLNWGVPVPQQYLQGKKVFYVWFDAPIGYISITADAIGQNWRKWWQPDPAYNVQLNQFMGKDNISFHSVIFPTTLLHTHSPTPYIKPHRLNVTEYLLYEGGKFSKSNNIGVFGDDCAQTGIKSDVWRYYLLLNRPETYDTQFQWADLVNTNKKELMNIVGNMCNRILKYTYVNLGNQIADLSVGNYQQLDINIIQQFSQLLKKYCQHLQNVQIKAGAHSILQMGQSLNKYIQDSQFWSKKNVSQQRNKIVVSICLRIIQFYGLIMRPYLPSTSQIIFKTLCLSQEKIIKFSNNKEPYEYLKQIMLNPQRLQQQNGKWRQTKLSKPEILFQQIPQKKMKQFLKKYGVNSNSNKKNDIKKK